MTAEQRHSPNHLLHIPSFTTPTQDELLQWAHGESATILSNKRRRPSMEEPEEGQSLSLPLEKSPRKNDDNVQASKEEETEFRLIDVSKLNPKDILLAYKRIWDNLDLSKPTDAKLESFVWHKIREYQKK